MFYLKLFLAKLFPSNPGRDCKEENTQEGRRGPKPYLYP
jgi:hypothetical protein